ncbi:MAG: hypothetical protein Q8P50_12335 [Bacillota bacterium]|nr:hypothetical protein [Bacillota bacterium]
MVVKGLLVPLLIEVVFAAALLLVMYRARHNMSTPRVRKVAGLDALEEAIGRATEMGRPVHFTPGTGDFGEPMTLAALIVLNHVARIAAKYDTRLIVTNKDPSVYPVTESIVQQAYLSQGRIESFVPMDVRYLSNDQFGYASGVVGILHREKVAANMMFGLFYAESLIFAEAGNQAGSIQIAGSAYVYQLPMFVAACDYTLIGDEFYAAGAYLSQDPVLLANLTAQDWGKGFAILAVVLGSILRTFGSSAILDILKR